MRNVRFVLLVFILFTVSCSVSFNSLEKEFGCFISTTRLNFTSGLDPRKYDLLLEFKAFREVTYTFHDPFGCDWSESSYISNNVEFENLFLAGST